MVPAPALRRLAGIHRRQEPAGGQAHGPERAVVGLDEPVVGGLAGAGEVQGHVVRAGPQVEVARDELAPVVDRDRPWTAEVPADPLQRPDHVRDDRRVLEGMRRVRPEEAAAVGAEPLDGDLPRGRPPGDLLRRALQARRLDRAKERPRHAPERDRHRHDDREGVRCPRGRPYGPRTVGAQQRQRETDERPRRDGEPQDQVEHGEPRERSRARASAGAARKPPSPGARQGRSSMERPGLCDAGQRAAGAVGRPCGRSGRRARRAQGPGSRADRPDRRGAGPVPLALAPDAL